MERKTYLKSIRAFCLNCMGKSSETVRDCPARGIMKKRKPKRDWIFILLMVGMSYCTLKAIFNIIYDQYREDRLEQFK